MRVTRGVFSAIAAVMLVFAGQAGPASAVPQTGTVGPFDVTFYGNGDSDGIGLLAGPGFAVPLLFKQDAPDFYQSRKEPDPPFPYPSENYCGPVAAADGIVWLHDHGFDRLPYASPGTQAEYDLVMDLAAEMGTDQTVLGTLAVDARDGLAAYLDRPEHYPGQSYAEGRGLSLDGAYPDPVDWDWTGLMLSYKDTCIITLGGLWFRWSLPENPWFDWQRLGGHYLFVVGYDLPTMVYYHDPATDTAEELEDAALLWQGDVDPSRPFYTVDIPVELPDWVGDLLPPGAQVQTELRWEDAIAYGVAEPGTWERDADGAWTHDANWFGGAPGGVDACAHFLERLTQPVQVTVDAPVTLGRMTFDCSQPYTLAGAETIRMEVSAGQAVIEVVCGGHEIAAPLDFASDAALLLTGDIELSGDLSSAPGVVIEKSGDGTLVLSGLQSYGPGTLLEILGGIVLMNTDASGTGLMADADLSILVADAELDFACDQHLDTLTIDEGGLARFTGANVVVVKHLVMNGIDLGGVTLTPEPATLALLATGGLCLALTRKRSQAA